jgi:polyisoprenoid-binding protein YceI
MSMERLLPTALLSRARFNSAYFNSAFFNAALAGVALFASGPVVAANYAIDANHTQVHFTYDHNGYSHLSARFNQVTGSFDFDAANPAKSSIAVSLPISSLSTGVPRLDTHIASADMLDAAQFPTAGFKSNKVTVLGKDHLSVAGDLTIHGVTKPVVFDVNINSTAPNPMRKTPAAGFDAKATIKRSDFGVSFMLPGVADDVALSISMEARVPRDPAAPAPAAAPAAPAAPADDAKKG